jgi:hypothetical protein
MSLAEISTAGSLVATGPLEVAPELAAPTEVFLVGILKGSACSLSCPEVRFFFKFWFS